MPERDRSGLLSSPLPDVEIPDVALTPFVLEEARRRAGRPALIDGPSGRVLTFGALDDQVRRVAGGLVARGLAKGDAIGLLAPNSSEYVVAFHAGTLAGGIVTTINPLYTRDEIAYQLNDSGVRVLVTVPAVAERASAAARDTQVEEIAVIGEASFAALQNAEPLAAGVDVDPAEDVAALPYSSGTTGHPKGVMLTHRNLVANVCQVQAAMPLSPDDVVIGALPFFHIYGMTVIMNLALRAGATVVTMPRFDLEGFLRNIQEHRVTRAYIAPPIALALANDPIVDRYDLASLQLVVSGAAPLGAELQLACAQRLGCDVCQGYGMTESSPASHGPVYPGGTIKPGTIGVPVPSLECRIVDDDTGADADAGQRGELWMRGPNIMKGYLGNEEATRATVDEDGWLHTGDVAIIDDDGCFSIVDRVKELIKYKGFQVAPAELEALLVGHPEVADVAVVGVPDANAGELPKAYIVPGGPVTAEELQAYVAERVATYKQVRAVEFVDEIPRSAAGKILRRVLAERGARADRLV